MKTLHKNKLLVVLFGLFMALCAVLGILSTVPRLASADESFDWSKYDDPANYTETVIYEKGVNSEWAMLLGQFQNKVFRVYTTVDDTIEAHQDPHIYLTGGESGMRSARLKVSNTGVSVEAWKSGELYSNSDMFKDIDYRVATDNSYGDFYIEDSDVLFFGTEQLDITAFEWLNAIEYTQKITILELDEVEPLPEVTEDSNFLDDVATWFNDNLGVSFTSAGVVVAVIIFVILIKKK